MQTILILEFKGFTQLSTALALKMEEITITPERIRAAIIEMTDNLIENVRENKFYNSKFRVGGDTFVITFNNMKQGIDFGVSLLSEFLTAVNTNGYYYLKPCACISKGEIVLHGDSFIDDTSISTYRIADKHEPFTFWAKGIESANELIQLGIPTTLKIEIEDLTKIDWIKLNSEVETFGIPNFKLPELLLDNEVIFSKSPSEAMKQICEYQSNSSLISAFGGPIPFDIASENDYLKQTISLIKSTKKLKWNVISYLDLNDKNSSFYWLELARRITSLYPDKYNFTAYAIAHGTLVPFSYQTFDNRVTLVGLRSYSLDLGRATMSSAIIFRNQKITERFNLEFTESYRKLGKFDDDKFSELLNQIHLTDFNVRKECMKLVDKLLN